MIITWIMEYPTGHEMGRILTVDMGGTNLRVCDVCLGKGKGDFEQTQRKYNLPAAVKSGTDEQLWDFVADRLGGFIDEHYNKDHIKGRLPLAFTFSFPVDQKSIRSGVLKCWTKNFNVSGVEGQDIVSQLDAALQRKVRRSSKAGNAVAHSSSKFRRGSWR